MAPSKTSKEERTHQKTPQRSLRGRRRGGAPRADELTAECEETEEEWTPRPHTKGSGPLGNEGIPDLRPTSDSCSIASDASSAASRAQSPVKTLADLRMAERPTYIYDLNGNEAEAAGGVLSRYTRLMEISCGIRVIPRHLKVSRPIDDPKLSKRLVIRRTSSKRNSMSQTGHQIRHTRRLKIYWTRSNESISRIGAIEQIISAQRLRNVHGNH